MKTLVALLMFTLAGACLAEGKKIPLDEYGFIAAIPNTSITEVMDALGTPDRVTAHTDSSGRTVASVVRYRNLVTDTQGDLYKITDLEVVGDKVVNVRFTNNDSDEDNVNMTF
jgi:hypothetical protein